jgi:hypothetical protein
MLKLRRAFETGVVNMEFLQETKGTLLQTLQVLDFLRILQLVVMELSL